MVAVGRANDQLAVPIWMIDRTMDITVAQRNEARAEFARLVLPLNANTRSAKRDVRVTMRFEVDRIEHVDPKADSLFNVDGVNDCTPIMSGQHSANARCSDRRHISLIQWNWRAERGMVLKR